MRTNPDFHLFSNIETQRFFRDVVQLCLSNNPEELQISEPVGNLNITIIDINLSLDHDKNHEVSDKLTTLDQRRDSAIVCLRSTANAYTDHFNNIKREAGTLVLNTIKKFGVSMQTYNYQAQTSTIKKLLIELDDTHVTNAIALINMSDIVDEIRESNQLFGDLYMDCYRESIISDQIATSKLMQKSIKIYRKILAHIQANNTFEPHSKNARMLRLISEVVTKYNTMVNERILAN